MPSLVVILNGLVIIGIVLSAILTVRARSLISSIICLAATGSFTAVAFLMLQAPDVAIAEAAVGAVLSTILYVIALKRTGEEGDYEEVE